VKKEHFQHGSDIPGIFFPFNLNFFKMTFQITGVADLMAKDLLKPVEERYVHSIMSTEHGGILIFTFLSHLLALIHKALTIQVDTTFKRTAGDINEWEIVIWYHELQQGKIYYIPTKF
jgi:hypothetical protein